MDWSTAPEPPPDPEKPDAVCRIELTKAQRERVAEETGRELHFVEIADEDGKLARRMPMMPPMQVTALAVRYAEQLNERDAAQQDYLEELAAWQDAQEEESTTDKAEAKAEANIEEIQEKIAAFYQAEADAIEAAREEAIEVWDPKGKKRKKAGIEVED